MRIQTKRLELVAATLAHLDAELAHPEKLGDLLGAEVPPSWPPGEYDRSAMEFFHARLSESPDAVGWYGWYAVRRSVEGESACLIGSGGYLGPPGADGGVEIGYSIAPEHQARSFATELVAALRLHAFEDERVQRIIAHTNAANAASIRVLERSGFAPVGPGGEPGIVRYECVRTAL